MNIESLKEDATVKAWFTLANFKENTKTIYLVGLQDYIDFTGKSPAVIFRKLNKMPKSHLGNEI